jgi:hypothetical protein
MLLAMADVADKASELSPSLFPAARYAATSKMPLPVLFPARSGSNTSAEIPSRPKPFPLPAAAPDPLRGIEHRIAKAPCNRDCPHAEVWRTVTKSDASLHGLSGADCVIVLRRISVACEDIA